MVGARVPCPKTSRPVKEGNDGFIFPGFKEIKCPKSILGRTMLAQEYRDILKSSAAAGPYGGFMSKRTGNTFRATLAVNEKAKRVEFRFD